jgi:serine/threonine protein kinase
MTADFWAHASKEASFWEAYALGEVVGTGSFGVVRSATRKASGDKVAVKTLPLPLELRRACAASDDPPSSTGGDDAAAPASSGEIDAEDILKETAILRRLHNPYVIHMLEYFLVDKSLHIVMKLLTGGPLLDELLSHGTHGYTEQEAMTAFQPLLRALHYLHSHDITHRDVKLENLLLARPGELHSAVLCDFGLASAHFESGQDGMRWCCGSAAYMAPEVARRQVPYGCEVDLWSAGVVLHLLLTGLTPFAPVSAFDADTSSHGMQDDDAQLAGSEAAGWRVSMHGTEWGTVSAAAKELCGHLLSLHPGDRPAASAALAHDWFEPLLHPDKGKRHAAPLGAMVHLRRYAKALELPQAVFKRGQVLGTLGERSTSIFLVKEGTVEVLLPGEGGKFAVVQRAGPGELVGEVDLDLSSSSSRSASSLSLSPSASLLSRSTSGVSLASASSASLMQAAPGQSITTDDLVAIVRLRKVATKWIGKRRRTMLRAASDVRVVVLKEKDMRFFVAHDPALATEVHAALERSESARRSSGDSMC